jgi:hypothetical protein
MVNNYRPFHSTLKEYTFFSEAYGTYSKIDQIGGHKANLNKYKITEIISFVFSVHSELKLEIDSKRNHTNTWKLNKILFYIFQFIIKDATQEQPSEKDS